MAHHGRTPRNLAVYWKMEAAGIIFVPGLALDKGFPQQPLEAVALGLGIAAVAGFLLIGAAYWRGLDRRLRFGDRDSARRAIRLADRLEQPLLVATGGAVVAAEFNLGIALAKRLKIIGTVLRSRPTAEKADATGKFAEDVLPLIKQGIIKPKFRQNCVGVLSKVFRKVRKVKVTLQLF